MNFTQFVVYVVAAPFVGIMVFGFAVVLPWEIWEQIVGCRPLGDGTVYCEAVRIERYLWVGAVGGWIVGFIHLARTLSETRRTDGLG